MAFPGFAGATGRGPNSIGLVYADVAINASGTDRQMRAVFDKVSKDADDLTAKAGKSLGESLADNMADEIENRPTFRTRIMNAITRTFRRGRARVRVPIDVDPDINERDLSNTINRALRRGISGAGSVLSGLGEAIAGGLASIGSSVGNVGSKGPFAVITGALVISLIPALVGAVASLIAVLGPLVNILLLIPTLIPTVVASFVPLILVFQGLGTAIGAIMSGDKGQIKEALKGLSKSAQIVVKELIPFRNLLRDIKTLTQEAFFNELIGSFKQLLTILGPRFLSGFQVVARAFGIFTRDLIHAFTDPRVANFFSNVFILVDQIMKALGPSLYQLIVALGIFGDATIPYVEKAFKNIAGWVDSIAGWLRGIAEDGRLQHFMEEFSKAWDNLKRLASSGWSLVSAIVGGTQEEGRAQGFFDNVIDIVNALTDFFKSDLGKYAIQGMITLAEALLFVIMAIIVAFGLMSAAVEGIRRGLSAVFEWIAGILEKAIQLLQKLGLISQILPSNAAKGTIVSNKATGGILAGAAAFAAGGLVTSPTLATLGEDYNREVVIPLTDPARARQLANMSGLSSMLDDNSGTQIVFSQGSIQITFQGVVPSQEEAYRTGAAVGSGISDQLARRDARLAVRTR